MSISADRAATAWPCIIRHRVGQEVPRVKIDPDKFNQAIERLRELRIASRMSTYEPERLSEAWEFNEDAFSPDDLELAFEFDQDGEGRAILGPRSPARVLQASPAPNTKRLSRSPSIEDQGPEGLNLMEEAALPYLYAGWESTLR